MDHSNPQIFALMGVLLLLLGLAAPAGAAVLPAEPGHALSLNGPWRFKLETAESPEPFHALDYQEDATWHDLAVPGNWEIAGYSPATYGQPDNAAGDYRKWIEIPANWAGRRVLVNFDGVQNGAEIWLNGRPVKVTEPSWNRENYHESGWTAWQVDLTPEVKFGERNLLALRVTKNTRSANLDTGDYHFLGGIYRPVTLFSVPATHLEEITIQTRLLPDGKAEVRVALSVAGVSGASPKVSLRFGADAKAVEVPVDQNGKAEWTTIVVKPKLWSAEHPNLTPLALELKSADGRSLQTATRRVGIREISIKNGILLVNNVPVKLTGICRHDVYPSQGSAVGEELWRKDLTLMKAANINAIRTSHYPYGAGFYDLCDEMGFYVLDELPYCWCPTDQPEMAPAFLQRARETVARDKNHPCVITWAIGNENKPGGRNLQAVADQVRALDTTRPRLVSEILADKFGVEFDDSHYSKPSFIAKATADTRRRALWPHIFTENPNVWDARLGADYGCLDLWAAVLQRTWDVVWKSDGVPGSFLWEWQDRAVADKSPTKLQHFDPATGIQYLKTKGIVDGWRHPRPEYYHVKMIYAPIQVEPAADLTTKPGAAILSVTNRYSFTNLSEIKANWKLLKDGKAIKTGTAKLALAPRSSGKVELALPAVSGDALRVDFDDPRGWNVVSYQFALAKPRPEPAMSAALPEGLLFPQLNLVSNVTKGDRVWWQTITRTRAQLANIKTLPQSAKELSTRPLSEIQSVEADLVFENAPTEVVGHLRADYANGKLTYAIDWSGKKADIQELGWTFEMPHAFDRFSWKRQAPWSVYPETHIGRPAGTALPDSADVHLTNITRPDAFDFNSTKYQCDWATLTDPAGRGLRVEFTPAQRHHVRGGIAPDGRYQLIVNRQCSPPRDLSSPVVPDFYLEFTPNAHLQAAFRIGSTP